MQPNFPRQPTLDEQAQAVANDDASQPQTPRVSWWRQLLASLRLTPKLGKKNGKMTVSAEVTGSFKF